MYIILLNDYIHRHINLFHIRTRRNVCNKFIFLDKQKKVILNFNDSKNARGHTRVM